MEKICQGSEKAFSVLFDRYQRRMAGYFLKMLWNDREMAEDYTQELFTKIIRKPELFDRQQNFSTWIFTIASNMCKNAYRKRAYEKAYLDQLPINRSEDLYAENKMDQESRMAELNRVLKRLDEEKRELFLLRYQQEMSIKQLAELLNCSEGTIKSRLFYIRKKILELFEEKLLIE